uniref:RiboL-PSP-HEPN domain-containing protein n=1 Tax=Eiseniibacteriota bacterium TaxID=2212470 RepID=A0A832I8Y8_UNCEI
MSTAKGIRSEPVEPKSPLLSKAWLICRYAHKAASDLLGLYDSSRKVRRKSGGQTTDAEQDLLRAILVFASAGLDGTLKQIVKDAMAKLVECDEKVQGQLARFGARKLRKSKEEERVVDTEFLGELLAGVSPRSALTDRFIRHLTANSLQSTEQVKGMAEALGLDFRNIPVEEKHLLETFKVRNQIVHEMDADPAGKTRKRVSRQRETMREHINRLLHLADFFLTDVDKRLQSK